MRILATPLMSTNPTLSLMIASIQLMHTNSAVGICANDRSASPGELGKDVGSPSIKLDRQMGSLTLCARRGI